MLAFLFLCFVVHIMYFVRLSKANDFFLSAMMWMNTQKKHFPGEGTLEMGHKTTEGLCALGGIAMFMAATVTHGTSLTKSLGSTAMKRTGAQ